MSETEEIDTQEIFRDLEKRKKWIDGVCITGGDPTIHGDILKFCETVKKRGFGVKLDTNGSRPKVLRKILDHKIIDFVAMDVKSCFEDYEKTVGVEIDVEKIKESMRLILNSGVEYEFRTTVVPDLHNEKNLLKLAKELVEIGEECGIKAKEINWVWQNFRPRNCLNKKFNKKKELKEREVRGMLKIVRSLVPSVVLRE